MTIGKSVKSWARKVRPKFQKLTFDPWNRHFMENHSFPFDSESGSRKNFSIILSEQAFNSAPGYSQKQVKIHACRPPTQKLKFQEVRHNLWFTIARIKFDSLFESVINEESIGGHLAYEKICQPTQIGVFEFLRIKISIKYDLKSLTYELLFMSHKTWIMRLWFISHESWSLIKGKIQGQQGGFEGEDRIAKKVMWGTDISNDYLQWLFY